MKYLVDSQQGERLFKWETVDLENKVKLHEKAFNRDGPDFFDAVWSPCGQYIAATDKGGHVILPADILETLAKVPGTFPRRPAFHPAGSHICPCRSDSSRVLSVSKILGVGSPGGQGA